MDYTSLSLVEVSVALEQVARDARSTFAELGAEQLNWRPDNGQWSVAQCLQHLLTANSLMLASAKAGLSRSRSTVWQRIPFLPVIFGRALIRSQAPTSTRKYSAPPKARPTPNPIPSAIVDMFVRQQGELADWMRGLDATTAARCIMTSPFIPFVIYSVLDGCRLMIAHDRRHFQQARRMMQSQASYVEKDEMAGSLEVDRHAR